MTKVVDIYIGKCLVPMKLDSASDVSLIDSYVFEQVNSSNDFSYSLYKPDLRLTAANGSEIPLKGYFNATLSTRSHSINSRLYVQSKRMISALLSVEDCENLQLITFRNEIRILKPNDFALDSALFCSYDPL